MTVTITISLFDVLILWGIVQAIFFVVGLIKDDFFYPSITCPVFWYISRLVYILCKGSRYTYSYSELYNDDIACDKGKPESYIRISADWTACI